MGGAVSSVGDALSKGATSVLGPGGGLGSVGSLLGGVGGGLSEANPFHPINMAPAPTLTGPSQVSTVTAPTIDPVAAPQAGVVGTVAAPQGAQLQGVGSGSFNDFRAAQLAQINNLGNVATGHDSTAQRMLQQQTQQNVANQFAMANSARPGQQAAAMRNAMNNAAQMNANANVQGAQLGLQQQMAASGLIGNIAGQGSGQDITVAGQNAGNSTQASIAGGAQGTERAISQAGNDTQASIAGGQQGTQRAIVQGQLKGETNGQNIQAQTSNQNAGLKYNDQLQGQWAQVNGASTAAQEYQRKQVHDAISGAAQGIPVIGGMFGGGGGGVPGGADSLMGSNATDQAAMAGDTGMMTAFHGGIVPTPNGIHIPYSLLLKRMVG